MGRALEAAAEATGHTVVSVIDKANAHQLEHLSADQTDVVLEFTVPDAVVHNLDVLTRLGLPTVTGTTGWLEHLPTVHQWTEERKGRIIYGANFSIGVNILFQLNRQLARLMNAHPQYDVFLEERHHRQKTDAPSGTALRLANDVLRWVSRKDKLVAPEDLHHRPPAPDELTVGYVRAGDIPGTHCISYVCQHDALEVTHRAYSREGFAMGALFAAERLLATPEPGTCREFSELFV